MFSDIDECEDDRCYNNGTCIDGIASFSCDCVVGFQGDLCGTSKSKELNLDNQFLFMRDLFSRYS